MENFKEVSTGTGACLVDGQSVGLLHDSAVFRHNYELLDFENGQPLVLWGSSITKIIAEIECSYAQMNPRNLSIALGGIVSTTNSGSTPVTKTLQEKTFAPLTGQGIEGLWLDGGLVSSLVVKDFTTEAVIAEAGNYFFNEVQGLLYRKNTAADIDSLAPVKLTYTYTPPASEVIPLGQFVTIKSDQVVEFIHTRSGDGKLVKFKFWRGQITGQTEYNMQTGSWNLNKFLFKAVADPTHPTAPLGTITFIDPA